MNEQAVRLSVQALIAGMQRGEVEEAHGPEAAVEATRRMAVAVGLDRLAELRTAHARLNQLYNDARSVGELNVALGAQRELNKLGDLYGLDGGAAGDESELAEKVRAHLAHLDPSGRLPPEELARVAGARTRGSGTAAPPPRQARKRAAKKKTKKPAKKTARKKARTKRAGKGTP